MIWANCYLLTLRRSSSTGFRRPFRGRAPDSGLKSLEKLHDYDTPLNAGLFVNASDPENGGKGEGRAGLVVPSRFRIALNQKIMAGDKLVYNPLPPAIIRTVTYSRDASAGSSYSDFCGLRFPTLETSRNRNYWKDVGLNRLMPRIFPIKLPTHRKVDPLMREYIYFLYTLDPGRFRVQRIAERYGFSTGTVCKIVKEFSLLDFVTSNRLCKWEDRRVSLSDHRLAIKEDSFRDNVGYVHSANERDDRELEFQGDKDTVDWLKRQSVVVESMTAFPHASTRDGVPKRVDVDLTVRNERHVKVVNWVDPTDKIVF